jgi:hypothetical protein
MSPNLVLMTATAVLIYAALGFLFGAWARAKGYAFALGLLLAIVCTPVAAAIILIVLPTRDQSDPGAPRLSAEDKGIAAIAAAYKRSSPDAPPPATGG